MRDDLVPVQIEIDPMPGPSAFGAPEHLTVEVARSSEIVDGKSQMERVIRHQLGLLIEPCQLVQAFGISYQPLLDQDE